MYSRRLSEMRNRRFEEQSRLSIQSGQRIDHAVGRAQIDSRESRKRVIRDDYERVSSFIKKYTQVVYEDDRESCDQVYREWEKNKQYFSRYKDKEIEGRMLKYSFKNSEEIMEMEDQGIQEGRLLERCEKLQQGYMMNEMTTILEAIRRKASDKGISLSLN
jgi:hypothetical protein